MRWLTRFLWGLLALLVFFLAAFAVNQQPIALQFLRWSTPELSVFWWLAAAFGLGLTMGLVGMTLLGTRSGLRNRRLARKLDQAEQELSRVRNLPLQE